MPPNLGGFFMVRSYYPSECHADYFDFERIEALKPAIEACGISTLSQSHPSVDKQASHFVHIPGLSYSGVKSPTECQQSLFESHFASRQSLSDCPVAF